MEKRRVLNDFKSFDLKKIDQVNYSLIIQEETSLEEETWRLV
jgi:hypothetical protein